MNILNEVKMLEGNRQFSISSFNIKFISWNNQKQTKENNEENLKILKHIKEISNMSLLAVNFCGKAWIVLKKAE